VVALTGGVLYGGGLFLASFSNIGLWLYLSYSVNEHLGLYRLALNHAEISDTCRIATNIAKCKSRDLLNVHTQLLLKVSRCCGESAKHRQ
jgi:hypothetical protein